MVNEILIMQRKGNTPASVAILNLLVVQVKVQSREVCVDILSMFSLFPLGWLIYVNNLNVLEQAIRSSSRSLITGRSIGL